MQDTEPTLPPIIGLLDRVLTWIALIFGGAALAFMTVYWAIIYLTHQGPETKSNSTS